MAFPNSPLFHVLQLELIDRKRGIAVVGFKADLLDSFKLDIDENLLRLVTGSPGNVFRVADKNVNPDLQAKVLFKNKSASVFLLRLSSVAFRTVIGSDMPWTR